MPSATTSAPQRSARSRSVADDLQRGVAHGAALDERQVDLDDVEAELAEQPQAGVAGADVVGREPDAGDAAGLDGLAQPVEVLDRLALGQLEDDRGGGRARSRSIIRSRAWTLKSSRSSVRGERLTVSDAGQAQPRARSAMTVPRQAMSSSPVRPVASAAVEQRARIREARCPAAAGRGPRSRAARRSCRS